jgi:diaminopimelate decarboxylase
LAGSLVSTVQDIATTGSEGHAFLKLDTGMTEVLRPSLYGAQHPIVLVKHPDRDPSTTAPGGEYVVVGHCCESGDLLTPALNSPETITRRHLGADAAIGDLVVIEGAGAYCSSMSTKHYNSFPECAELMLDEEGVLHLIRKRQPLEEIWANEVPFTPSA